MLDGYSHTSDGEPSAARSSLALRIVLAPTDTSIHALLALLHRKRAVIEHLSFDRGEHAHTVTVRLDVRDGFGAHMLRSIEQQVQVVGVARPLTERSVKR